MAAKSPETGWDGGHDRLSLFLLGAGFNIDATREAGAVCGTSIHVGPYQIDCGYPLVADVLKLCFGLDNVPTGKSVEDLFAEALQAGNTSRWKSSLTD